MSRRLWDKGEELNKRVHDFTVGNDPQVDLALVYADALGSAAHAQMLLRIGVLDAGECKSLLHGLQEIAAQSKAGAFVIPAELEDCHTAIENQLGSTAGEAALKIHTGRSRNDQVILAMRLYLREKLTALLQAASGCVSRLFEKIENAGFVPMPGYTHFQPAMPSSIGLWLHAYAEAFLETIQEGLALLERLNVNPLGSASGFGSSLPLDRALVAEILCFSGVQRNPINIQNSRGRTELKAVRLAADFASITEKFAWDMILYSTREFGFITLPLAFTTGSSIMPQKHNPDVLELLRARAGKVRGAEQELAWVCGKLPSNYHRDLQYTKEPVIRALDSTVESLHVLAEVISSFGINESRLAQAMSDDLYATYEVYERVKSGVPFREAYRSTAELIREGKIKREQLSAGFEPIQLELEKELTQAKDAFASAEKAVEAWNNTLKRAEDNSFNLR